MQPVIFLMGPTAAGKTDLAVSLVERFNAEIISVDSALIYKDMDIGTAKPDAETLRRAPHRLIDIIDPAESYSVAQFRHDALEAIEQIHAAGKIPLLAGGTMLYYKALLEGLAELPSSDAAVRDKLVQQLKQDGLPSLVKDLQKLDPISAARITLDNPQRVIRALEVFLSTGTPISEYWDRQLQQTDNPFPYVTVQMAVAPQDRAVLHQRIEKRFHIMLEQGFEQEVINLKQRGDLHLDLPSMRCVGYRQMWQYLDGVLSYEEMIEKGIIATRQLAKRQLTWLRGWQGLQWFDSTHTHMPDQVFQYLAASTLSC